MKRVLALLLACAVGHYTSVCEAQTPAVPVVQRPAPAPFHPGFHVHLAGESVWRPDRSYDLFGSAQVSPAFGIAVGRRLTSYTSRFELGVEVSWRYDALGGMLASTYVSTLANHLLTGGVTAGYAVTPYFLPYLRAMGGTMATLVRLQGAGAALTGSSWAPAGTVGAGVMLRTTGPLEPHSFLRYFGLQFAVEGGAQLVPDTELLVSTERVVDPRRMQEQINTNSASLGVVQQTAPYLRVTAGLRF